MAERSPFETVFDPDQGGYPLANIMSLLGRGMGVKSTSTQQNEILSNALTEFSRLQNEGSTPQQAFLKLMQTPIGQEVFRLPGGIDALGKAITHATPPAPTTMNVGPGQRGIALDRYGNRTADVSQPTTATQDFQANVPVQVSTSPGARSDLVRPQSGQSVFSAQQPTGNVQDYNAGVPQAVTTPQAGQTNIFDPRKPGQPTATFRSDPAQTQERKHLLELAQLPQEQVKNIAELLLLPDADRRIATIQKMVDAGKLSAEVGQKLIAGPQFYDIKPINNFEGKPTGQYVIFDKLQNQAVTVGGTEGTLPTTPRNPSGIADPEKTSMFLGTGLWARVTGIGDEAIRTTLSNALGTDEGNIANIRKRQLEQLDAAVTSFPETVGRTNVVVNAYKKLLPRIYGSTLDSVNAGIELRRMSEQGIDDAVETIRSQDPYTSVAAKQEASKMREGYMRILRQLPPMRDMEILREKVMANEAGSYTAATGVRSVLDAAKQGAKGVMDTITGQDTGTGAQPDVPLPRSRPDQGAGVPSPVGDISTMSFKSLIDLMQRNVQLNTEQRAAAIKRLQEFRKQREKAKPSSGDE